MAPQVIPSTSLVPVLLAGAMSAPASIGTPSKPTWPAAEDELAEPLDETDAVVLDEEPELLPHPASAITEQANAAIEMRATHRRANGIAADAVIGCTRE